MIDPPSILTTTEFLRWAQGEIVAQQRQIERLERLLGNHYHSHEGVPYTTFGEWPQRIHERVATALRRDHETAAD